MTCLISAYFYGYSLIVLLRRYKLQRTRGQTSGGLGVACVAFRLQWAEAHC